MEVEPDWLLSFKSFVDDVGVRPQGTSLDRIDVTKGYLRGNCRWSTPREQARNKTNTIYVDFEGRQWVLINLCEELEKDYEVVRGRLKLGLLIEEALDKPKRHSWMKISVDGKQVTLREYCKMRGADYQLTRDRLRFGWELEEAVTRPKGYRRGNPRL